MDHMFFKVFIFIYVFDCAGSYLQHVGSSSLTRDQTCVPCIGSLESATEPPGKSLDYLFFFFILNLIFFFTLNLSIPKQQVRLLQETLRDRNMHFGRTL